jgi:hypothetical protein
MLCYKDMTFCDSECSNLMCHRYLSDEIVDEANKIQLPIALSDLSLGCGDYRDPISKWGVEHELG